MSITNKRLTRLNKAYEIIQISKYFFFIILLLFWIEKNLPICMLQVIYIMIRPNMLIILQLNTFLHIQRN